MIRVTISDDQNDGYCVSFVDKRLGLALGRALVAAYPDISDFVFEVATAAHWALNEIPPDSPWIANEQKALLEAAVALCIASDEETIATEKQE